MRVTRVHSLAWVLSVAHFVSLAFAFSIISNTKPVSDINGVLHSAHQLVIECDETDGSNPQTITVTHNNGSDIEVTFRCPPPEFIYIQNLEGYIPAAVFNAFGTACERDSRSNATNFRPQFEGENDSYENGIGEFFSLPRNNKRSLQQLAFFGGIVVGEIANTLLCGLFKSCGGSSAAEDAFMGAQIRQNEVFNRLINQNHEQVNILQGEVRANTEITRLLGNSIYQNTESIIDLNLNVNRIESQVNSLKNALSEDFINLDTQIQAIGNFAEDEWNVIGNLTRHTTNANNRLLEITQAAARRIRSVSAALYSLASNTQMQNMLTELYHSLAADTYPRNVEPFVRFPGIAPASGDDLAGLNTLAGAAGVANVMFQRTVIPNPVTAPTDYVAQQYNITFVCRPQFALDNLAPNIEPRNFYEWIGPSNSTFDCYPGDPVAQWSCDCAFLVEYKECDTSPSFAFPWQYDPPVNDLYTNPNAGSFTSHCSSGVIEHTIATGGAQVFTDQTAFENFLQIFCDGVTYLPDPNGGADASRVRIFSEYSSLFDPELRFAYDLHLDNSTVEHVCAPSYATQYSGNSTADIVENLPYVMFHVLVDNYIVFLQFFAPWWQQRVNGVPASDLLFIEAPFTRNPQSGHALRCTDIHFSNFDTDEDKLPVFRLDRVQELSTLSVHIGNNEIPINGTSVPVPGAQNAARVSARTTSLTVPDASALPPTFYRIGHWVLDPDTPPSPLATYDVPFNLISGADSVQGRVGSIDYTLQHVNWTKASDGSAIDENTPITMDDFLFNTKNTYDPRHVGASASSYKRSAVVVGTKVLCDTSFEQDGVTPTDAPVANNWCKILSNYVVEQTADKQQMIFRPDRYSVEYATEVPAGEVYQTSASHCPSGYVVVTSGDGTFATVFLNVSTSDLVSFEVLVKVDPAATDAQKTDPSCVFSAGVFQATATNPAQITIGVSSECGQQYVNVRPIGETGLCYPAPGIVASTSHASIDSTSGLDGTVAHAIVTAQDKTQLVIEQLLTGTSLWVVGLAQLRFTAGSAEEIAAKAAQLAEEQVERLRANRTLNTPAQVKGFEQNEKAIRATSEQVGKNVIASLNNLQNTEPLYETIANLTANFTAINAEFNATEQEEARIQAELREDLKEAEERRKGHRHCHWYDIFCLVENMFSRVFGGIFGAILHVVMFAVAGILFCCCGYCIFRFAIYRCIHGRKYEPKPRKWGRHHLFTANKLNRVTPYRGAESGDDETDKLLTAPPPQLLNKDGSALYDE